MVTVAHGGINSSIGKGIGGKTILGTMSVSVGAMGDRTIRA